MADLPLLSSVALKTSALLLFVAVVSGLHARSSAAVRHRLWACALTICLVMPFAITWGPSLAILPSSWAPSAPRVTLTISPRLYSSALAGSESPQELRELVDSSEGAWPPLLLAWLIGAVGFLLRDVLAHAGLIRWMRRARPLRSAGWIATLQSLPMKQRSRLLVMESTSDCGPCTWGFIRPVLMLPAEGDAWPESRRRHALLHEQAHLDRHDAVSTLIARLACAIHWYNPLVWLAAAKLRGFQEEACDDAVLRAGGKPSDYAQFLLDVARKELNQTALPMVLGMARRSPLHTRIRSILDARRSRVVPGRAASLAAVCLLGSLAMALAAIAFASPATTDSSSDSVRAPKSVVPSSEPTSASASANPIPRGPTEPLRSRHDRARWVSPPPSPPIPAVPALTASSPRPAVGALPSPPTVSVVPVIPSVPAVPAIPTVPATPPTGTHLHEADSGG